VSGRYNVEQVPMVTRQQVDPVGHTTEMTAITCYFMISINDLWLYFDTV
jgi:sortase (surface protein transpeptidase)